MGVSAIEGVWMDKFEKETVERTIPLRTMLGRGIHVALEADPPANDDFQPRLSLWSCLARETMQGDTIAPEERITPYEALRLHTIDAAYAGFEEKIKGSH